MQVPAQRFQPTAADPDPGPSGPLRASRSPSAPTEVTRRVSASGLIGVCYQQVSAGRHLAGQIVTVRLHPTVLQVFFAGQLIRTVPRTSTKEVVQLRAHRPHQPKHDPRPTREVSTITRNQTRKHQPELDTPHGSRWHGRRRHRPEPCPQPTGTSVQCSPRMISGSSVERAVKLHQLRQGLSWARRGQQGQGLRQLRAAGLDRPWLVQSSDDLRKGLDCREDAVQDQTACMVPIWCRACLADAIRGEGTCRGLRLRPGSIICPSCSQARCCGRSHRSRSLCGWRSAGRPT